MAAWSTDELHADLARLKADHERALDGVYLREGERDRLLSCYEREMERLIANVRGARDE